MDAKPLVGSPFPEFEAPDAAPRADATGFRSHEIISPRERSLPLVFSSPHSGDAYPAAFVRASRLSPLELRRSEDSFVDQLFLSAPEEGAPLLRALFPRAYVDANREPFELDQAMFKTGLPDYANTRSPRVAAGLGTIARIVASGAEIYSDKLEFKEVSERIRRHYWPYHTALRQLVDETRKRFGFCILIDCHSMPSNCGPLHQGKAGDSSSSTEKRKNKASNARPSLARTKLSSGGSIRELDMVLGDSHGQSCSDAITEHVEASLTAMGYRVGRNDPYAGGFVTRHYGRPATQVHALQIEINRGLYMDEAMIQPAAGLKRLQADLRHMIRDLSANLSGGLIP